MNTDITSDDKIWAALGYPIFPIAIIMLLMEDKKKRPFIKYHAVQALGTNVLILIVEILWGILSAILAAVTFGIGGVISCVAPLIWLVLIWPAILAYQGKYFEVPVITKFMRSQHWIA
jgi:uncharacterized membrane protein